MPHFRLHLDSSRGGAWCPSRAIRGAASPSSSSAAGASEYLEIDLGRLSVIRQVLTQGRYAMGLGQEYAEAFTLQYWRPGMTDFKGYRDSVGREVSESAKITPATLNSCCPVRACASLPSSLIFFECGGWARARTGFLPGFPTTLAMGCAECGPAAPIAEPFFPRTRTLTQPRTHISEKPCRNDALRRWFALRIRDWNSFAFLSFLFCSKQPSQNPMNNIDSRYCRPFVHSFSLSDLSWQLQYLLRVQQQPRAGHRREQDSPFSVQ